MASRRALRALAVVLLLGVSAWAQGGPPYFTNDPGTPGPNQWEINVGYMPLLNSDNSSSHVPDLDINYGVGDRIQLTYENAWLRVTAPGSRAKYGLGQSNFGVKWRFYDAGEDKLQISVFPQGYVNNPNHAARRGIVPDTNAFELPLEFTRKFGSVNVDLETGYTVVRHGANTWMTGLVVGRDITKRLELDGEFYGQGTFHGSDDVLPLLDLGARYKLRESVILLAMAGRSLERQRENQSYFVGYFGVQFLLGGHSHKGAKE